MMGTLSFDYIFYLPGNHQTKINIQIDSKTLTIKRKCPDDLPDWALLSFRQCPNCPLSIIDHSYCPLSANLVTIIQHLDILCSHHQVRVKVVTENRTITQDTTIQKAVSSLVGLITATSGCPHTVCFKPMARFHLPLSDESETISRVTSLYLLGQYFLKDEGKAADFDFTGLRRIYENLHIVNLNIAKRLKSAIETDSVINAVILLDLFTNLVPASIENRLEEIRFLFEK